MTSFLLSAARVLGVALLASGLGWGAAGAFLPRGPRFRLEKLAWSYALGTALIAASVPLAFLAGMRPGWIPFLILSSACLGLGVAFRVSSPDAKAPPAPPETSSLSLETRAATGILWMLILFGVSAYALQALTEPMWSNDFVAIWGLKGKIIYGVAALPARLHESAQLGFSHPEYPLGLPFLYAGVAFLVGRWDDHAMAVLFPLFQIATLAGLIGWLRRKGASLRGALLAAAILANLAPLYSGFLTGLAEIPLSFGLLLFGSALADALGSSERGSLRRLALSAAVVTATKNEGLFLAVAGCVLGLVLGGRRRLRIAAAALPTALLIHVLHLLWRGRLPLRDFDFRLFSVSRLGEALAAAARVWPPSAWAGAVLVVLLIVLGARRLDADAMLALAAAAGAAYLLLPAVAIRGPAWLVQTTLLRVSAGLAPLLAAAIARRYAPPAVER